MESTDAGQDDSFGVITGGSYQFLLPLAEGGMGRVDIVVRHEGAFRRLYALKRLHTQFRKDETFRAMFLDEARIAGLLRHPNVVSVLDVGEDEHGPFLVMDFVDGVPLSAILKRNRKNNELLPIQLVLTIVAQAARGLHAAHELANHDGTPLGLVHRDVSPQNLLVSFNGAVQMTDFGVAKALGRQTKTQSGVLKGKYGYMSPEQLRFQEVDRRSDLFSLGVVLFELIAGRRLYGNGEVPAPRRILEEPPPDAGEERDNLMPELVELCFELLAKQPEARPDSAKETADRLDEIARALAAEEGSLDLTDYMEEHFGELRAATQARIEATIEELASAPPLLQQALPLVESGAPNASSGPNRALMGTVFVLLALGGIGLAYFFGLSAANTTAEVPTAANEPNNEESEQAPPVSEAEPNSRPVASPPRADPAVEADLGPDLPVEAPMAELEAPRTTMRPSHTRPRPVMNPAMTRPVWMWPDDQ